MADSLEVRVPHLRQMRRWDCGYTAILMVLPAYAEDEGGHSFLNTHSGVYARETSSRRRGSAQKKAVDELVGLAGTQSSWTIDLAAVLGVLDVPCVFATSAPGVSPDYASQPFYASSFADDTVRVEALFDAAHDNGIHVFPTSLPLDIIRSHVVSKGPAIVLVNGRLLDCTDCHSVGIGSILGPAGGLLPDPCGMCSTAGEILVSWVLGIARNLLPEAYLGHYIVVLRIDNGSVWYRDPAVGHDLCSISVDMFNAARSAFGTDDDVLLIGADPEDYVYSDDDEMS